MAGGTMKLGSREWKRIAAVMGLATVIYAAYTLPGVFMHGQADVAKTEDGDTVAEHNASTASGNGGGTKPAAPGTAMAADVTGTALGLGRPATAEEIAAWDIDVRPDGAGLPKGSGSVEMGEEVFIEQCAVCHGDFGEGVDRWPVLAGGQDTLADDRPVKTIGSYWPYLSTVWDYIHRAMPFGNAQSLTDDEVYAITAYLLYMNDLVEDDFVLSDENFQEVRLPNEANFFMDDRAGSAVFTARDVCMTDCKTEVKITARARVLDVTPETEGRENTDGESGDAGGKTDTSGETKPADATKAAEDDTKLSAKPADAKDEKVEDKAANDEAAKDVAAKDESVGDQAAKDEPADGALDEALVAAGAKQFRKCKACHAVGDGAKNKVGPILNGIYNASVGAVADFKYSKALKAKAEEGAVWTDENLHAFLTKPKKWAKGTKMSFNGMKKEKDRAAVIEFLKSYSN